MDLIHQAIQFVLHLDQHIAGLFNNYGSWAYFILFMVVFCETGLVVFPFLPGDSLLFAAGSIAAISQIDVHLLAALLIVAAFLGNTVNYWVGYWVGPKVFKRQDSLLLKKSYLESTHEFYEKYGPKAVIISRFLPIIRTFVPFMAGIARMNYITYSLYNLVGALIWVLSLIYLSYFFGGLPIVQHNFSLVIVAIIVISILPAVFEVLKRRCSVRSK